MVAHIDNAAMLPPFHSSFLDDCERLKQRILNVLDPDMSSSMPMRSFVPCSSKVIAHGFEGGSGLATTSASPRSTVTFAGTVAGVRRKEVFFSSPYSFTDETALSPMQPVSCGSSPAKPRRAHSSTRSESSPSVVEVSPTAVRSRSVSMLSPGYSNGRDSSSLRITSRNLQGLRSPGKVAASPGTHASFSAISGAGSASAAVVADGHVVQDILRLIDKTRSHRPLEEQGSVGASWGAVSGLIA